MKAAVVLAAVVAASGACSSRKPDPAAVEATRARALAAYEAKRYDECAQLFQSLLVPQGDPHQDGYSAACCLARAGQPDRALEQLQTAVRGGYRNVKYLQADKDLAILQGDPRWLPLVEQVRANSDRYRAALNPELRDLFEQDQADRRQGINQSGYSAMAKRDEVRLARVRQILAAAGARVADDYYHAAMVLQHGEGAEDFRQAHELCLKTLEFEAYHSGARWLAAASKDRELMALGKPQLYGTQFNRGADGKVERWPVDPSITNKERARWHVDPIPEAR